MNTTKDMPAANLECECLPPLDLPDTWGVAWERHLVAAEAWQVALAETEQAVRPAHTMRTVARMTTLMGALCERLLRMQSEAADVAIAEISARDHPLVAGEDEALRPLRSETAERLAALTRNWFEMMASAQAEMSALTGVTATGAFVERRHRAAVISFPDRRRAA